MFRKLFYFLPTQLFLISIKRNHFVLLFWIILFGIVGENLFVKYGIPYLFLAPEYLNEVSVWSYFIMGFSIGGFVMAFNVTGYIINSNKFPFIATLKYPFLKYCINNSLLPLLFIIYFCFKIAYFLHTKELYSNSEITIFIIGLLGGYISFVFFSLTYFFSTNKNIFKILGIKEDNEPNNVSSFLLKEKGWFRFFKKSKKWHVEYYLHNPFKTKNARDISHYDTEMLKSVFKQNKINASIFEITVFLTLIGLGFLSENPIFIIPAGASVVLFFTTILILFSAMHTWLQGWTGFTFIVLFIIVNLLSKYQTFSYTNMAYGLNYTTQKAEYSIKTINDLKNNNKNFNTDYYNELKILENWKSKNNQAAKPKLIYINTSGGGSRASLWTFFTLQQLDSLFNNKVFKQSHLITGSSGGMIGAAYYRELYLLNQHNNLKPDITNRIYINNMAKDLLNPIAFYMATNDFFIRTKKYNYNGNNYTKDRGYAFEKQLLINTENILDKKLLDYKSPEVNAQIPIMIFSPTIINDGRRLLISAQHISYLNNNNPNNNTFSQPIAENIEFSRLFKNQDAANLKFTSALRMSATFPYIMPNVSLPSEPQIDVLDAGMRDNYGALSTFKHIHTFKNWINDNTSGVIVITIRDKSKDKLIENNPLKSIIESANSPIGSLYGNLFQIQDYNLDDMLQYLSADLSHPIDVIDFELESNNNQISLSWHLTKKEKTNVLNSIHSKNNQKSIVRLAKLLEE
ncbi:patatin-like phospholipase family protein [Vicingus serpentipes]|uniref:Patatin-like phospholipase family protein n=1 Tax=Vicingus serpentipes TaxID=1926625 RepID=A0A5C6RXC0_9FLAO|nr:patatin-like phospholipase family protein [Vicingus serpentipes]TXB66635.1 patatin-like phospholipase family protein [Vicingus serpentipes]